MDGLISPRSDPVHSFESNPAASGAASPANTYSVIGGQDEGLPGEGDVENLEALSVMDHERPHHVGAPQKTISLQNLDDILNPADPKIKQEIISMVIQYLKEEGYNASLLTVQDEAKVKMHDQLAKRTLMKKMKKALIEGDWNEVENLCKGQTFRSQKSLLYAIHKQQYLELVSKQEYQMALTVLQKRLKPLESHQSHPGEFRDLCYVLACRNIQEAPSFKNWDGPIAAKEQLLEQFQSMLDFESQDSSAPVQMPPHRLLTLLKQAVAYQIEFSRYHPRTVPKLNSLLEDYSCFIIPNSERSRLVGHRSNVKCVAFVGADGKRIASGSSDNTVRIWDSESGRVLASLSGHTSRIWDVASRTEGDMIASASGDGSVKLWDVRPSSQRCLSTLLGHSGDVYTVDFHPGQNHLATGGYDKTVRLWDARRGVMVKSFTGHNASVCSVLFNPHGNLIISGSKDSTIKFWDIVSGVCIRTISSHLGEVTSVVMNSSGSLLLSASKDNSNRLWDIRNTRPVRRFKGHQNTSKNFVRAAFGPREALVVGGSEDGLVYVWDVTTGQILQRLAGHKDIVYSAVWNTQQSLMASCSHDDTVRTWWYDESKPVLAAGDEYTA